MLTWESQGGAVTTEFSKSAEHGIGHAACRREASIVSYRQGRANSLESERGHPIQRVRPARSVKPRSVDLRF
jgi:hypothetical protein